MKATRIGLALLLCLFASATFAQDDLDNYIARLRKSEKEGGKETAFMSPGSDFLYGQGYFDKKSYDMAAMYFKGCVEKEPENPYFNYQYAVSLIHQRDKYKSQQAQPFLDKAFALNPSLKIRFEQTFGQSVAAPVAKGEGLQGYIERLKYSRSTGGKETEMLSAGSSVMYGYDYYERGEFGSAETNFRMALARDADNPYINYLLGVSLHAQGRTTEAQKLLTKAYAGDPSLKQQFAKDAPRALRQHQEYERKRKPPVSKTPAIRTNPATTTTTSGTYGGTLIYGDYACTQTVWNGPNASPAFRNEYKGYFRLNANGTYRWLDNGVTGNFSYDAKTGTVQWKSGKFANDPTQSSRYSIGQSYNTITIQFPEDRRWECSCKK